MHLTGFEPVMFQRKASYEPDAFDHSATDAFSYTMELVGIEPTSNFNLSEDIIQVYKITLLKFS